MATGTQFSSLETRHWCPAGTVADICIYIYIIYDVFWTGCDRFGRGLDGLRRGLDGRVTMGFWTDCDGFGRP